DWGHARDYVAGMWQILQQDEPDDYVLATGKSHTVREFTELAFAEANYRLNWKSSGSSEQGLDAKTGRVLVEIDPRYFRPTEVDILLGDASKARDKLGWAPIVTLSELVAEMVAADLKAVAQEHGRLDRRD